MSLDREALAKKCEARADDWLARFDSATLITVGDLATVLRMLAQDIRESHFKKGSDGR